MDKTNRKILKNYSKLEKARKLWYRLFLFFWPLLPNVYFRKGNLRLSLTQFWNFPKIFQPSMILSLTLICNTWQKSYIKLLLLEVSYFFYFWWIRPAQNVDKLSNNLTIINFHLFAFFLLMLLIKTWKIFWRLSAKY